MSDELATVAPVAQVLGGMLLMKGVDFFWGKFLRRGDELEKKLEAAKEAAVTTLQTKVEAIEKLLPTLAVKERVDGALKEHRKDMKEDHDRLIDHESRLRRREGLQGEGNTNPGYKLSPEMLAALAEKREG